MNKKRCATCTFWDRAFRLDANGLCTNSDGLYFNLVFSHEGHCPDWKELKKPMKKCPICGGKLTSIQGWKICKKCGGRWEG